MLARILEWDVLNDDYLISVDNVSRIYRVGEVSVEALRGVSLDVTEGEAIAIMGPSGSGKTTLLNLIGALDRPTSGSVRIDGMDITKMDEKDLTAVRRDKISFVFQFFNLLPVLSAYENVELPLLIGGIEENARKERVDHLLELVGLTERAEHRPDELSGGEQQRVAIARALAKPKGQASSVIVLADEPTGDLDTRTGEEIMQVLRELTHTEGGTLIVVTHDPEVGQQMEKLYTMRDGTIVNVS
ncbi:ABC transporter ATP-binding protein [Candidatus Thorarchaeota archaeon]|nr:MAG: ABC transporter ATP-binding protein [Candidatus Thorarchaeota archaeon]